MKAHFASRSALAFLVAHPVRTGIRARLANTILDIEAIGALLRCACRAIATAVRMCVIGARNVTLQTKETGLACVSANSSVPIACWLPELHLILREDASSTDLELFDAVLFHDRFDAADHTARLDEDAFKQVRKTAFATARGAILVARLAPLTRADLATFGADSLSPVASPTFTTGGALLLATLAPPLILRALFADTALFKAARDHTQAEARGEGMEDLVAILRARLIATWAESVHIAIVGTRPSSIQQDALAILIVIGILVLHHTIGASGRALLRAILAEEAPLALVALATTGARAFA